MRRYFVCSVFGLNLMSNSAWAWNREVGVLKARGEGGGSLDTMAVPRAKRWTFTLNNYTAGDCERLNHCLTPNACHFVVVGKEVGEGGTLHQQGFAYFKQLVRFATLKWEVVGEGAHLEVARADDKANDAYCSKGGDLLLRVGEPNPGHPSTP